MWLSRFYPPAYTQGPKVFFKKELPGFASHPKTEFRMQFSNGRRFAGLAACVLLGACSTVMRGTTQQVAVSTPGAEGTSCRITGGDSVNMTVNPPATVRLPKSKDDLRVTCQAANEAPVTRAFKSSYSDWSYVQSPVGYVTDAATGAMWVYPARIEVPMAETPTAPRPQTLYAPAPLPRTPG